MEPISGKGKPLGMKEWKPSLGSLPGSVGPPKRALTNPKSWPLLLIIEGKKPLREFG